MGERICSTFVGESFAVKGFRFYNSRKKNLCPPNCKLYQTCQANLEEGEVYQITEIQEKKFECPHDLHEEPMVLVKIVQDPITLAVPSKNVYEGALYNFQKPRCEHNKCEYYGLCVPEFRINRKEQIKILERCKKIKNCKAGKHLSIIVAEKIEERVDFKKKP